ncbi:SAM hydrolase/SAM-dependent halogenase family protein [Natrialba asiatica]|uniref:NAD operon protein n=1 Tax=Natrialba asiatica (strain ATCC 700177 / DSM 12278 / JCM 9576 / FERM P-10747 / NBRC 102637 / 172P1) TaxID=29540 RepID=M0AJV7_NATA1|nr:SAM-dependent chlorinase/fluorinase [Natrialba asiatica]ELY98819.1 NAD operon protein [Natrialba asiatica DSM 12278]
MITLSSDFGTPYPAAMRGVLSQRTATRLVDVAHDFPRQDIRAAAFWLHETLPYFPPAVHLVVVDPGVGTDRNALAIRAGDHVLVGPDNGVLLPAARRLAATTSASEPTIGSGLDAYIIDDAQLDPPAVAGHQQPTDSTGPSSPHTTFHGRDVFAPAAGDIHEFGLDRLDALTELAFLEPTSTVSPLTLPDATVADGRATGEVLVVDDFGNAITNVPGSFLADCEHVRVNGERVPVATTFGAVPVGERLATVGSHGYVELDVNQGRGDETFGLIVGASVTLESA